MLMVLFLPFLAKTNASTVPNWTNKNISISYRTIAKDTLSPLQREEVRKIEKKLRTSSIISFVSGCISAILMVLVYVFINVSISMLGVLLLCLLGSLIAALFAIISSAIFFSTKNKHPKLTFRNGLAGVGLFLAILSIAAYVIPILIVILF
jgi:VIT1/CCC1 family predicted Fe2+/Mn2+ transporter